MINWELGPVLFEEDIIILPRYRAVGPHEIASACANSVQAYAVFVEARFLSNMGDKPPVIPPKEVRGKVKSSKEDPSVDEVRKSTGKSTLQKGGKRPTTAQAPKDNPNEGNSSDTLNATALGSVIAEVKVHLKA